MTGTFAITILTLLNTTVIYCRANVAGYTRIDWRSRLFELFTGYNNNNNNCSRNSRCSEFFSQ